MTAGIIINHIFCAFHMIFRREEQNGGREAPESEL